MLKTIKNAIRRRRLIKRGFGIAVDCAKSTYGQSSGAWVVCPDSLNEDSVVYGFGVGTDLSFDLAIIKGLDVKVHAFDPTPASIEWVRSQSLPDGLIFHDIGVANYDGDLDFYPPRKSTSSHFTPVERYHGDSGELYKAPVKKLSTIMNDLGHAKIDVLKIDIEGGEYDVIDDLLNEEIEVDQLLIEFHHMYDTIPFSKTVAALQRLHSAGYKVFAISERSYEMSLMRSEQ